MKKIEQKLTTELLKNIYQIPEAIWCEVKVVERPKNFAFSCLSEKAKKMLGYTKLKHKFSDAARTGTPLDFVWAPFINVFLCVIFYGSGKKKAYFIKYDNQKGTLPEEEIARLSKYVITW